MFDIIKLEIYYNGEYYCEKYLNFKIFSQGKTLDESDDYPNLSPACIRNPQGYFPHDFTLEPHSQNTPAGNARKIEY